LKNSSSRVFMVIGSEETAMRLLLK